MPIYLAKKQFQVAFVTFFLPVVLMGQWREDLHSNLSVENLVTAKAGLKMVQDSGGNTYLLWFGRTEQYHLFVQRIDRHGYINWPVSAVQISGFQAGYPNPALFAAIVDREDDLVIALDRAELTDPEIRDVYLIKMDSLGSFPWGEAGIRVHDPAWQVGYPSLVVDVDNTLILSVIRDPDSESTENEVNQGLALYRISPDGVVNADVFTISMVSDSLGCGRPYMFFQPDQTLMVAFQAGFMDLQGVAGATHDKFFVTLLSGDLEMIWDKPVLVFEGYSRWGSMKFTAAPSSTGGCYVAKWENSGGMRVQKVGKDGKLEWGPGGHNLLDLSPSYDTYSDLKLAGTTSDGNLAAFYLKNQQSLIGQMITPEGSKKWGIQGTARAHGILNRNFSSLTLGDDSYVIYESNVYTPYESPGIAAMRVNWWGDYVFGDPGVALCSNSQPKGQVLLGTFTGNQAVAGWLEKVSDAHYLVKLQNLYTDGKTGPLSSSARPGPVSLRDYSAVYDPATRMLTIESPAEDTQISLSGLTGVVLFRRRAEHIQILPELPAGIYVLTVFRSGTITDRLKLIF